MSSIWFTADTHFNCPYWAKVRRFSSAEAMNAALMQNWNNQIEPDDVVYHLGDFAKPNSPIADILEGLKGRIILIHGESDDFIVNDPSYSKCFYECRTYEKLRIAGKTLILFHYPIRVWEDDYRGSIHLHGHSHGFLSFSIKRIMDVGVDANNLKLVSFDDVLHVVKDRLFFPEDFHNEEK